MAVNQTSNSLLKVNQLSKDLNMKSKDLAEMLTAEGIEYKTQKVLDPAEFNVLFNKLTSDNQITNIEDYIDGITYIPSKKAEAPKAEKAEKAEETKPAAKETAAPAQKAEEKKEEPKAS